MDSLQLIQISRRCIWNSRCLARMHIFCEKQFYIANRLRFTYQSLLNLNWSRSDDNTLRRPGYSRLTSYLTKWLSNVALLAQTQSDPTQSPRLYFDLNRSSQSSFESAWQSIFQACNHSYSPACPYSLDSIAIAFQAPFCESSITDVHTWCNPGTLQVAHLYQYRTRSSLQAFYPNSFAKHSCQ